MQVWISKPHGAQLGGLEQKLRDKWLMSVDWARNEDCPVEISFLEPEKYETHGELLTRLWDQEIRDHTDPSHLISELDFIPTRQTVARLISSQNQGRLLFIGAHYVTRNDAGGLQAYTRNGTPLTAAWIMALRMEQATRTRLPNDWLAAGGPKNDAANLAVETALVAGALAPFDHAYLPYRDGRPVGHWVRYPKTGKHLFFARSLDEPDDTVLLNFNNRDPLTVGEHRRDIRRIL